MLRLYGTLPVMTNSAERTFISLKRLKTYLSSTCGQERLSSLALLACNSTLNVDEAHTSITSRYTFKKETMYFTSIILLLFVQCFRSICYSLRCRLDRVKFFFVAF